MQILGINKTSPFTDKQIKQASHNALASLLNLTFLPGLAFIYLLIKLSKAEPQKIEHYHARLGVKLNLIAAVSLFIMSGLMIFLGGFDSAWTWAYVITYFTFVHTVFILIAVWAMIRAWSGQELLDN
ncbi:MAG: hypothetical protein H8E21_04610 [Gammaproteobacteria bacterium]|nr:hypothetical protein [Gammaproteobacteria bacterium]MBL6998592.1 hypothetical protein [Gammaproteobacteria bacterium]